MTTRRTTIPEAAPRREAEPAAAQRRRKRPTDRSRAETFYGEHFDDLSKIATPPERERALRAIEAAGFPKKHRPAVLEELAQAFRWYKQGLATTRERPRTSALEEELSTLAERAELMRECLQKLSPAAKQKLADIDTRPLVIQASSRARTVRARALTQKLDDAADAQADLADDSATLSYRELQAIMRRLHDNASAAVNELPPDRGGIDAMSGLRDLANRFHAVWKRYDLGIHGVTKHGVSGSFRGPLVELMVTLCTLEGVRVHSANAVGRVLHEAAAPKD